MTRRNREIRAGADGCVKLAAAKSRRPSVSRQRGRGNTQLDVFLGARHDNLPTAQGLDAEGEATNGQGPVAYPGSPELLNRHGERHVLRMATWKADELSGHVQGWVVEAPFPARNFAEDVPRKGAAELVNTIYVPPGRAVRIERGVNSERGGPLRERGGVHDGRAPAIDGRHH